MINHGARLAAAALAASLGAALGPGAPPATAAAPTVQTNAATSVGPSTFDVSGGVTPNGSDTSYYFEWSEFGPPSPGYTYFTSSTDLGSTTGNFLVATQLRAVSDWTYHWNLHASNADGQTDGTDRTVKTPPYASSPGAPGDLDVPGTSTGSPGFASQGRAGPTNDGSDGTSSPSNYPDQSGTALAVQHDGSVIVAGTAGVTGFSSTNGFAIRRFTSAGAVDTTFNSGNAVVTTFTGESNVIGNAVRIQQLAGPASDDGIVVAGTGSSSSGTDVLLARYGPDGSPDATFGPGGATQVVKAGGGTANGLVVAPDNTLWVAGGKGTGATLWHISANGTSVLKETTVPGTGGATAIVRQSDGSLVEAAGSASSLVLIRFTPTGALDPTFGKGGIATASASGPALAVAVDEHSCASASCSQRKLIAAGGDSTHFKLGRFTNGGALDTSFGSSGIATTSGTDSPAHAVVVQGDGEPIAGGVDNSNAATGPEMLLTRYQGNGGLDPSFGIAGRVRTGYPDPAGASTSTGLGAFANVAALALQADGRVLAAGSDANEPQIIAARTRDASGGYTLNTPVPDIALVRYQGGPPGTRITFAPPSVTGAQRAAFSFTSTVSGATFQCSVDSGAFKQCTSGESFGPLSFSNHTFSARSTDAFGHTDPHPPVYKWTICSGCSSLPKTSLTGEPPPLANSKSAAFTFIADDPTDRFECQLDGSAFSACSSPDQLTSLSDGSHTFAVRAVNALGPDPAPPNYQWRIDTVAPHTTITSGPSGTVTDPTATFAFTSDKAGSSFQCQLDGGGFSPCFSPASYVVSNGSHIFTVRAADQAGNVDPAPPSRTFKFEQSECSGTAGFSDVTAKGCFGKKSGRFTSTPGSDVNLDGLTLHPGANSTTITIDPVQRRITSSGSVLVSAGDVQVDSEQLGWTVPKPNGKGLSQVGALNPPPGASVGGLPFEGDVELTFNHSKGADIAGNVQLPFGAITSALDINGTVTLHTTPAAGLLHDEITLERDDLGFDGVEIKKLKVVYSTTNDLWEGAASIVLPTPNELAIAADLQFLHGSFHKFSGSVDNLNIQVIDGIYLQRIAVVFGVDPTTIGGGLGLSFGPEEDGGTLVRVDGNFLYQAQFGSSPGHIHVDGMVTLAGFKLANGYFDYFTSGLVKFGAHAQLGLPDTSDSNPHNEPVFIDAVLDGVVQAPHFDVDVKANVDLNFIDTSVQAEVLVSDVGLVACAHLSAFGFGWSPGAGYNWSTGNLDLMFDSCSVGPYKTLPLAADAAAAGTSTLRLPPGGALVALSGATAQPDVTLSGPGGQHVTVPTTSVAPLMVPGFMVFQDPKDRVTYVAIQHSGGLWQITAEPGSSAITQVRTAALLPSPKIKARVTGGGRKRILTWHLRRMPGQRVVFWERGRDSAQIIGSTTRSHGRLLFTIANGAAGSRAIVAQVMSFGNPREDLTVAHFIAPPPQRPARPGHLKAAGTRGGALRISWRRAALAQQYIVEVDTSDGAHLIEFASGRARGITVHDVVPIHAALIKVTAALHSGLHGRTAVVKFRAKPPPKRHHRARKKKTKRR